MNKRQKLFVIIIFSTILVATLSTAYNSTIQEEATTEKVKVAATFYPLAFFAKEIGGDKIEIKQLIPDNTEVHDWQPSIQDILAIEEADIIFYNGASLDHWFEDDILPIIDSSNKIIIETTKGITLLETGQENNDQEHQGKYDPHTWISPFIAEQQAQNIYNALIQKDPKNKDYYTEHWQNLKTRLEELDSEYLNELSTKQREEIFVSHSAYGYLAYRYNFVQHGVIGISADEQPSASTYEELVAMMLEHQIFEVYVDPVYSEESAQVLKNELERLSGHDVKILRLYLMLGKIDNLDYFGQQQKNLENLKIGLEAQ